MMEWTSQVDFFGHLKGWRFKRSGFSERQALSILVLPAPIPTRTKPRRIALSGMKHSTSSSWLPCFLCASAGPG